MKYLGIVKPEDEGKSLPGLHIEWRKTATANGAHWPQYRTAILSLWLGWFGFKVVFAFRAWWVKPEEEVKL